MLSDQVEEVNLESGIMKRKRDDRDQGNSRRGQRRGQRGGQRDQRNSRDQREQRDSRGSRQQRRSRSRSQQRNNDRGINQNREHGEVKNGGGMEQRQNKNRDQNQPMNTHNDNEEQGGFTAVIRNMLASNKISEILQDIKIRAGDVKNFSVIAEKFNARNLDDSRIEIHATFYTAQSRDKCISQYNEANLDEQVLQCYKL